MSTTILIVDDDEDATFLLSGYLQRAGFSTRIANSLTEGQTMLRDAECVLCDRNLGDGDGLRLFEKGRPNNVVWAVILSGAHTPLQTASNAEFDAVMEKPFDAMTLVANVRSKIT